jgi:hypothetical protein
MLYPEAFAMVITSNSRHALAARRLAVADLNSPCAGVEAVETGVSSRWIG